MFLISFKSKIVNHQTIKLSTNKLIPISIYIYGKVTWTFAANKVNDVIFIPIGSVFADNLVIIFYT